MESCLSQGKNNRENNKVGWAIVCNTIVSDEDGRIHGAKLIFALKNLIPTTSKKSIVKDPSTDMKMIFKV